MTVERFRQRRLLAGCAIAAVASVGLMAFSIAYYLAIVSEMLVVPLVAALAVVMGIGTMLAVFNLRRS